MNELIVPLGAMGFGIWLLVKGGDWAIDSSVYIAEQFKISKLFIAFTILAFGTSFPELIVSVNANLSGHPGIALGNVLGSNIANLCLILGITAIIWPVAISRKPLLRSMLMMLAATLTLVLLMQQTVIPRITAGGMFTVLIGFVIYQYFHAKTHPDDPIETVHPSHIKGLTTATIFLLVGFILIALGSELLIKSAIQIGRILSIPESIISLTMIAFGTSVPELVTCISAAKKHHTEMVFGNVIGSNIFNILAIVGITAIIKPLQINQALLGLNIWFFAGTAVIIGSILLYAKKLGRIMSVFLLALYTAFIITQGIHF